MNKGGKFLKKLWCCVGGRVKQGNLVLSTELITEIGKAKVGIVGFVCVYKQKIELRYCWEHGNEKDKNKFVE